MVRSRSRLILLMILISLGAPSHRALSVGAAELPTIEVGLPDDGVFGLGGHYLVDKGLDRKNGFIMKARWSGVAEIERLLAIGAIPVGLSTSESAVRANTRAIPIRLIQPFMTPHNSVLVRKESPYKNITDLKGKPFAVPGEVTAAYNNFDYIMRKQGMQIEKYFQLKKLGAAGISTVLERGEVEAGYSWEAHASKLLATGRYRILMVPRDELNRLLNTKIKMFGWLGAIDSWVGKNRELIPKIRSAWQEAIGGVQGDEAHFRKHAKNLFGLEKPEEIEIGWPRTRQFLLPPDFPWPDRANLEVELRYLKEAVELGIFPKEGMAVIDKLFVP
ncbi:MAG: ABC transporter substrate-binding protein [Deltaproteobacteria bacterium]|nr:ABC transporter substrate-binding protein [Deltaproteobacteria bacterium]